MWNRKEYRAVLTAGFTLEQIADMTGHHGNAMIWNSYAHLDGQ